jgi:hypothetical protein
MRLAREFIGQSRSELLDRVLSDLRVDYTMFHDWRLAIVALEQEFRQLQSHHAPAPEALADVA